MSESEATILVEYVGLKPKETDCVAGTGVTWTGLGDVQAVPASAWKIMAQHTDVWKLVEAKGPALGDAKVAEPAQSGPAVVDAQENTPDIDVRILEKDELEDMTDQQVRLIGTRRKYTLNRRLRGVNLREKFLELQGV